MIAFIAWISFITALTGLVTALLNAYLDRGHRRKSEIKFEEVDMRFDEVHRRLNGRGPR